MAPGGDPGQVTKLMPGVQRQAFGSQVVIRGSAPGDSKYYIDDLEVPFVYHGVGQYTVLPTPLIEDVEFSAGGFGAEYGDATGGVVKIRSKTNLVERATSIYNVNFPIFSSAYHERPVGKNASLSLSVRRSYLDLILPKVLPKDSGLTVVPYFSDYVVLHNQDFDDGKGRLISIASTDGIRAVFPADFAQSEEGTAAFSIFNYYGILGYERTKYFDAIRFDRNDPFFDPEEAPREEGSEVTTTKGGAAWIAMEKNMGGLLLIPGLRGYYNDQIKKGTADPRFSARFDLNEIHGLKFATGQFSKNPEPGQASVSAGNPDLKFERSIHYVAGIESRWSERWNSDVQLFKKKSWALVRADSEKRYVNSADLESSGAEILIRRNMTERFFGWFSYTWSKNRSRDASNQPWHNAEYDQTHVANLAGNYRLTEIWELGGRLNYHTGDTFTQKGNAVYNANLDKYQPRAGDIDLFAGRLPNYNELSVFAGRDFLWDTWKMNARFGIEYFWFKRAALGVDYNYDYTKESYLMGVPPIPYLEVQATL
ncbi:MAG: hypothetical protein EBU49_06905 [Proteobacteria bacterium]|nr:hypothetical protein [Pseudomonadota bacterium]